MSGLAERMELDPDSIVWDDDSVAEHLDKVADTLLPGVYDPD